MPVAIEPESTDDIEPHVAISFGLDGEHVPPSSGPISRSNIAGRYRLDSRLAEGGMGIVYAGWHVTLDQPVAIKVIQKDLINNAEAVKRFIEEARALAQLRGPHVAQVLDAGIEDGTPFIVMELLKGRDLRTLLGEGQMSVTLAAQLVREACEAVSEAHAKGIVHRDLKPENLYLAETENGSSVLKVIDFGISARQGADGAYDSQGPGPGSPEYMAPEQLLKGNTVDHRADIWSLGIVLYELLTGGVPFTGDSPHAICSAVVAAPPPSLKAARPGVPVALEAVVLRCLHKSPTERFANAQELAQALSAFEPAPVELLSPMRATARSFSAAELDVADTLAPAQVGRRLAGSWRVGAGLLAGCAIGVLMYFVSRTELFSTHASIGPAGAQMLSGDDSASGNPAHQGPIVEPVSDSPNVSPILRDENDPGFRRRPRSVAGPLLHGTLNSGGMPRGSVADRSIDAELDDVGNAVAGLVAETSVPEEGDVEARYALAASKPKGANDAQAELEARPSDRAKPEAGPSDSAEPKAEPSGEPEPPPVAPAPRPPLILPKVPASAAFPDATP
jgi:serine/threonine protein kinase